MIGFFIFVYLGFQLLIGFWLSKKIQSEDDYLLAGRSLPLSVVAFSLFATWFGAETCIGSSAAVYNQGLSGSRADPFGYSLCLFFLGLLIATRLWQGGYTTLSDYFKHRYGHVIEKITVWILVPSSLMWAAAQVRAFGQVISATTEIEVFWAITLATLFVIVYTAWGGLMADIFTDVIQGLTIAIGLVILLVVVVINVDFSAMWSMLDSQRLSFVAPGETWLERIDRWMVPILGSLVAQELISRVFAAKSASVARKSCYAACGIYLLLGMVPVVLGLIGPLVMPGMADSEQFLMTLAQQYLSPVLFVVLAGALVAAILATIDSILLAVSALISHNIVVPLMKNPTEKERITSARTVVMVSGLFAYVMALQSDSIYDLVEAASSFGTAGILIIMLMGLYSPWKSSWAAASALAAGLVLVPLGEHVFEWQAPYIAAIGGALLAFFVGELAYRTYVEEFRFVRALGLVFAPRLITVDQRQSDQD